MKPALLIFSVLTSLSFLLAAQGTPPVTCRGKPLPVEMLPVPGPKITGVSLPLRFGGTRQFPVWQVGSDNAFRLVIKNRDEFRDFWKRLTAPIAPGNWVPPLPEIDFSKEMLVVAAMGPRPSSGYVIMVDGACEVDGHVEVFISNVDTPVCGAQLGVLTAPADVVRLPRTDLPIVFRETQVPCTQWSDHLMRLSRGAG